MTLSGVDDLLIMLTQQRGLQWGVIWSKDWQEFSKPFWHVLFSRPLGPISENSVPRKNIQSYYEEMIEFAVCSFQVQEGIMS